MYFSTLRHSCTFANIWCVWCKMRSICDWNIWKCYGRGKACVKENINSLFQSGRRKRYQRFEMVIALPNKVCLCQNIKHRLWPWFLPVQCRIFGHQQIKIQYLLSIKHKSLINNTTTESTLSMYYRQSKGCYLDKFYIRMLFLSYIIII